MAFKYENWQPDQTPLQKHERPVDPCAPMRKEDSWVKLKDLNINLNTDREEDIKEAYAAYEHETKFNKLDPKYMPEVKRITLGELGIKLDMQRPQEDDHIINIMAKFDFRRLTTARGAWDPELEMYMVTEGQQRVSALRNKIMRGDFAQYGWNKDNWENFPINLEIVTLEVVDGIVDYGPEIRTFIQENSEKLPVSLVHKFKAEVHGKNTYSFNKTTYPSFEKAADTYKLMKQKEIVAAEKSTSNSKKAGAMTHVHFLHPSKPNDKPLSLGQLRKVFDIHNKYSKHEPLYGVEVLPILKLLEWIEECTQYDSGNPLHVAEVDQCWRLICGTVHKEFLGWDNYDRWHSSIWKKRFKNKTESKDADYSIILMLQCLQQAGYTFPFVDQSIYTMYNNPSGWQVMSAEEKGMFL